MHKRFLRYIAIAATVVCLICAATVYAASFRANLPESPNGSPELQDDERDLESVEKNRKYYLTRRFALEREIARLDENKSDDPAKEERRAKLVDELIQACRGLAFADDSMSFERWSSLDYCAKTLFDRRDVAALESLKDEVEAPNWNGSDRRRLAHLVDAFIVKTKIAKAIEENDAQTLENILPELAQLATDDGASEDALVNADVASYVEPIVRFNAKLGAKAKLAMRRGFRFSSPYSYNPALDVEYKPEIATLSVEGVAFSYDKSLLDVPQYETTWFYKERIASLENLLSNIPENVDADEIKQLRADARNAIMDCYEQIPFAVDLIPKYGIDFQEPRRLAKIEKACQKLAQAGETARLDRLAEHKELRAVVSEYRPQAAVAKAIMSNDETDASAAIDALTQWAFENPDNVAVAALFNRLFNPSRAASNSAEKEATIDALKTRLRDALKNAENPAKLRLAYLDALQ